jgi:intracellular multiplication protein IcmV
MKTTKDGKPLRKPFFNFRGWLGWDEIARNGSAIKNMASTLFEVKEPTRLETFEESLVRQQLTETDVLNKLKKFKQLFIIFFIASICLFTYALYMLISQAYISSLACFGLTAFLLAQTFRYHFWWFQMKHRKLGCTFKEWLQYGLWDMDKKGGLQK